MIELRYVTYINKVTNWSSGQTTAQLQAAQEFFDLSTITGESTQ